MKLTITSLLQGKRGTFCYFTGLEDTCCDGDQCGSGQYASRPSEGISILRGHIRNQNYFCFSCFKHWYPYQRVRVLKKLKQILNPIELLELEFKEII